MAKWLFKSDPDTYSFSDLERDGRTVWDGVSNNLALKHLRATRQGDEVLIYHTGEEKAVLGLAELMSGPYPDPKQPHKDGRLTVVDLAARKRLGRPVTLAELRKHPHFKTFELVRLPRLSVMPVSESHWKAILSLAKS